MGLRRRVSLSLSAALLVLALLTLTMLRFDSEYKTRMLEEVQARADMRRLMAALEARTLFMEGALRSWANWSALHDHLRTPDPTFAEGELTIRSLQASGMDVLTLIDAQGVLREVVEVPGKEASTSVAPDIRKQLPDINALLVRAAGQRGCGLLALAQRLALACYSPVLNSDGQGPASGHLLMGRWVDDSLVQQVAAQTGLQFRWKMVSARQGAGPGDGTSQMFASDTTIEIDRSDQQLVVRTQAHSVLGRPAADIFLDWPRLQAIQAGQSLAITQAVVLAMIAACAALMVLLIDHLVVRRLNRLHDELRQIVESRQWSGDVTVGGKDELGELAQYTHELIGVVRQQVQELHDLAQTDALTGLANRRAFNDRLHQMLAQNARHQMKGTLVLIDVDQFKKYNDLYGHPQGDEALRQLAQSLRTTLRRELDMPVRLGGEEFAVLLGGSDLVQSLSIAEQLRLAVQNLGLKHQGNAPHGVLTVSMGLAEISKGDNASTLYHRADQALYQAKENGRNQINFGH